MDYPSFTNLPGYEKERFAALGLVGVGAQQAYRYYQQFRSGGGTSTLEDFVAGNRTRKSHRNNHTSVIMNGPREAAAVAASVTHTMVKRRKRQRSKQLNSRGARNSRTLRHIADGLQRQMIFRYQSLSPFVGVDTAAHIFSNKAFVVGDKNALRLPVFAFNLSAMPVRYIRNGAFTTIMTSFPFYQLFKTCPNVAGDTAGRNYYWEEQPKKLGNELGETEVFPANVSWDMEKQEHNSQTKHYVHEWSDINILLQAAKKYQTRVHLQIVSFLNGAGPRRRYFSSAEGTKTKDLELVETDEIAEADYFWDRFLQKKIVHPLAAHQNSDKRPRSMAVFHSEIYELPIQTTISSAAEPITKHVKLFYTNGASYNLMNAGELESTGYKMINHNAVPSGVQTKVPPGYPTEANPTEVDTDVYVDSRSADKWLLISGEVFNRDMTENADNYPSFDINVRGKWTYTDSLHPL